MIVRILGDGMYEVGEADLPALERLDEQMGEAIDHQDEETFAQALADLIGKVRQLGSPVPPGDMEPESDLVVPHEGSSLHEVKTLLEQQD
jgi:hypothetical protein